MRFIAGAILLSLCAVQESVAGQPATVACVDSQVQLEANKKLVLQFFAFIGTPEEQAQKFLADDYVQHNPRLVRMDEITRARGRAAWLLGFHEAQRRGIKLADISGIQLDEPVVLMAECDFVTAIFATSVADPDRPDRNYEAFAFETFRIRNGKFTEHWDQVRLEKGWMASDPAKP